MAEAHARLPGREQLREALRLLDLAAEGDALSHSAHLRRARYLELLGDPDAAKERSLASQAAPRSALDWFLRGQERWLAGDVRAALAGRPRFSPAEAAAARRLLDRLEARP